MSEGDHESAAKLAYRTVFIFVGMAGLACALTVLFLSMRAVMRIGGTCASGGPFEIRHPCPKGVVGLLIGSIWIGLLFAAVYAYQSSRADGPELVKLAWPALFLSLGYNFLAFGVHPPLGGGLQWGWLIPGVLFVLMGGVPLAMGIAFARSDCREALAKAAAAPVPLAGSAFPAPGSLSTGSGAFGWPATTIGTGPPLGWSPPGSAPATAPVTPGLTIPAASPTPTAAGDDVVASLERLAELHGRGELTDGEYESAKQAVLKKRGGR